MAKKSDEQVVVAKNTKGEAKAGTTESGQKDAVENTESIPQNGVIEIHTTEAPNEIAKAADEARTEAEVKFADESNPNQKGRFEGAEGEFDQDGNERSGGKSYGVAANANTTVVSENTGEAVEAPARRADERVYNAGGTVLEGNTNAEEYSLEDQKALEKELSSGDVVARVITSAGSYVKIKWFYQNKPFCTYKSRNFDKADAKKFLDEVKKSEGVK